MPCPSFLPDPSRPSRSSRSRRLHRSILARRNLFPSSIAVRGAGARRARRGAAGLLATWARQCPRWSRPVTITGKAISSTGRQGDRRGRAVLKAGKAAEYGSWRRREVREEWRAMSAAEQKAESDRLIGRTPTRRPSSRNIARVGEMVVDGDFARLSIRPLPATLRLVASPPSKAASGGSTWGPMT